MEAHFLFLHMYDLNLSIVIFIKIVLVFYKTLLYKNTQRDELERYSMEGILSRDLK